MLKQEQETVTTISTISHTTTDKAKIIPLDINGDPLIYPVTICLVPVFAMEASCGRVPNLMIPASVWN